MDVTKLEDGYEGPLMFIPGTQCPSGAVGCSPETHPHHGPRPFPLLAEARVAAVAVDPKNVKTLGRFVKSPVIQNIVRALAPAQMHCITMGQWSPVHPHVAALLVVGKFDEDRLREKREDPDPCKRPPCAFKGMPVVYVFADEATRKDVSL